MLKVIVLLVFVSISFVWADDKSEKSKTLYINGNTVGLRESPDLKSKKLQALDKGVAVIFEGEKVMVDSVSWIKVSSTKDGRQVSGWIDSQYAVSDKKELSSARFKELDYSAQLKTKGYEGNPRIKTKGIYLTMYSAAKGRLHKYLNASASMGINTFVVDVKNTAGNILFKSKAAEKHNPDANRHVIYKDLSELVAPIKEKNIYLIARVAVFKDEFYAVRNPDKAIVINGTNELFLDRDKEKWVSPYNREYWEYLVDLAVEAAQAGFNEIQFDYIRFPDFGKNLNLRNKLNESKPEALQKFLKYAYKRLSEQKVYVSADVFGLSGSAQDDMSIGQYWEGISNVVDYICPMMYPSHYANGYGKTVIPDAEPYRTLSVSSHDSVSRNKNLKTPAIIRPWIQDFTAIWVKGHIPYGEKELIDQIKALKDNGVDEYLIWNPRNVYTIIRRSDNSTSQASSR